MSVEPVEEGGCELVRLDAALVASFDSSLASVRAVCSSSLAGCKKKKKKKFPWTFSEGVTPSAQDV